LHPCSCTVPRIWESVNSTIIHNLKVTPAVHVFLQPVAGWSYLVSGIGRHSGRTERQFPICRLIWVRLLNGLTSIVLQRRPDWLTPHALYRGLDWLTPKALYRGLDRLTPKALYRRLDRLTHKALWRRLDRLALQRRLSSRWLRRTDFPDLF
jgi:hypothetical protein